MSDFTCRNGHAVSIKDKFCHICGLPIRYEDGRPKTYAEHIKELKIKKKKLVRNMESRLKLGER